MDRDIRPFLLDSVLRGHSVNHKVSWGVRCSSLHLPEDIQLLEHQATEQHARGRPHRHSDGLGASLLQLASNTAPNGRRAQGSQKLKQLLVQSEKRVLYATIYPSPPSRGSNG